MEHDIAADGNGAVLEHVSRTRALADQNGAQRAIAYIDGLPSPLRDAAALIDLQAKLLYESGRLVEAEAALRRLVAIQAAPGGLYMLGVVLQMQGQYPPAAAAFKAALQLEPFYRDAHMAAAELALSRTGDLQTAVAEIDAVLRRTPTPALLSILARILIKGDAAEQAYGVTKAALRRANDPELHMLASQAAAALARPDEALGHARAAHTAAPSSGATIERLASAYLAVGEPARALPLVEQLLAKSPFDQSALALQADVWRLTGDPRRAALYDYGQMVQRFEIEAPPGWASLPGFLAALSSRMHELHDSRSRTLGQSHRGGTKTWENLALSSDPLLLALFEALQRPVARYLEALGPGEDPLRSRAAGARQIRDAWSVRLGEGGRHLSHVHPEGWISAAFYLELPLGGGAEGDGWIHFGESASGHPDLGTEYTVRPEPGAVVLFPSYMWHGTHPTRGAGTRMTVSFDVTPG